MSKRARQYIKHPLAEVSFQRSRVLLLGGLYLGDSKMADHKIRRKYGGENEMSWIQPVCSCGWKGKKHFAWNDYQRTNVKVEISEHIRLEKTP